MKRFNLFIGWRYTHLRSDRRMVSFISTLCIAGLTLGVALLLTALSVMNGFERELRERILGILPHGAIIHRVGIDDWVPLRQQLLDSPGIVAAAPYVEQHVLLSHGSKVVPAVVQGIEPSLEASVSDLSQFLPRSLDQLLGNEQPQMVLGEGLAYQLNLAVGDQVRLIIPSGGQQANAKLQWVTLAAIIKTHTELDHLLAIMALDQVATASSVTGIRVRTDDLFQVMPRLQPVLDSLPWGYYATDWSRQHGNLYRSIQTSKNMVGLLLMLLIAIAAFNVVSSLVMVVTDKREDIAILKTLGASRGDIMRIFIIQGSMIGVIGTLMGTLLGIIGSLSAAHVLGAAENLLGIKFLNSSIYPIDYIPAQMQLLDFVWVIGCSLLMSGLATLYPSWLAARTEPAEALRQET